MYWGLGLLPGMPKKWKVRPIQSSAGKAQNTALHQQERREVLAVSGI